MVKYIWITWRYYPLYNLNQAQASYCVQHQHLNINLINLNARQLNSSFNNNRGLHVHILDIKVHHSRPCYWPDWSVHHIHLSKSLTLHLTFSIFFINCNEGLILLVYSICLWSSLILPVNLITSSSVTAWYYKFNTLTLVKD